MANLTPQHLHAWLALRKHIGSAIWEFLWLVAHAEGPANESWGQVGQGQPLQVVKIARELGIPERTVWADMQALEDVGLVRRRRAPGRTGSSTYEVMLAGSAPDPAPPESPGVPGSPGAPSTGISGISGQSGEREGDNRITPYGVQSSNLNSTIDPTSPESTRLTKMLYDLLKERGALPPTAQAKRSWYTRNLQYAASTMLGPTSDISVEDWIACLQWAGAHQYWGQRITSLSKLMAVWQEYKLAASETGRARASAKLPRAFAGLQEYVEARRGEDE